MAGRQQLAFKPWYNALKKIIVIEESGEEGILCNLTKREYVDGIGAVAIMASPTVSVTS